MTYLLIIAVLGLGIFLFQTRSRLRRLEHKQTVSSKILNAVIFAVYNKRKDGVKDRLIEIGDLEEAVKIVTAQKRPEQPTPLEDLAYILGDEMPLWKKRINEAEWDEHDKKEHARKDYFEKVRAKFAGKDIPDWAVYRMWHDKREINEKALTEVMEWQEVIELIQSTKNS